MKVRMTKHKIHRDYVLKELKANKGYCPCQIPKSEDTKCPCKNFREEVEEGWCICELFEKVKEDED